MERNEKMIGVIAGALAYVLWGILPMYWKLATEVPAMEILAYRIIWSFVFMIFLIAVLRKTNAVLVEVKTIFKRPKTASLITLAAILITVNWFIFIFTVNSGHVTEASLGYYINPLVNVLIATVFLKERLSRGEMIAVLLAFIGVSILTYHQGTVPYAALAMAVTFSLYGLIKKFVPVSTWTGLTLETLIITPFALIYLLFFSKNFFMSYSLHVDFIMIGAGIVTAIPLLLFATAAKKISYTMVGFLQYIGPTLMLILGVLLYKESFDKVQLTAFICIWAAILVFTISHIYLNAKLKQLKSAAENE
ncbi:RarD protein [Listeria fleischmannii 1991]|uniref:RarD protein n=2 Tax=Listeria fleischmannii TaxID=1069827 RepID=A0A0J8J2I7_9LIST|nr:EamA family transporter RarD [Listeria fleischmannii]KMT58506.1 RarD protein [Listeria fleischmannii 1991]SQC72041.1 putative chloramphenical resistance permease RarD [Listeria fleischmannii subsp. fleischmannii]